MLKNKKIKTYATLFSGAGIGCYGFNLAGFRCVATSELLEKRIKYQKINDVGVSDKAYVCGDISDPFILEEIKQAINQNLKLVKSERLDVLVATPPCQGMSVANHKKGNELPRNSLVVESIKLINELNPNYFVLENVPSFLKTICLDDDGQHKAIGDVIQEKLSGKYKIHSERINFADCGSQSSRTRSLVIGVSNQITSVEPEDVFPSPESPKKLKELIGDLPKLNWGGVCETDIYHSFRTYQSHMRDWIKDLKPGQSAFDNRDPKKRPHKVVDGVLFEHKNANGDKYKRQIWGKVAPCVHTRNDILASQNTVHPEQDRVFSIRELMRMMTIPDSFKFFDGDVNSLSYEEKNLLLKKDELNIRHSIGEAVPTNIFRKIAEKIIQMDDGKVSSKIFFEEFKKRTGCKSQLDLADYVNKFGLSEYSLNQLLLFSELLNTSKDDDAAFYTKPSVVRQIVDSLPNFSDKKTLRILEPSVGSGCFVFPLIKKYGGSHKVVIDVFDINKDALKVLQSILTVSGFEKKVKINFFNEDFLLEKINSRYDLVVGNPPFGKITKSKISMESYTNNSRNKKTKNIYVFFLEKAIDLADFVSLIVPKSILGTPELNPTRAELKEYEFVKIFDFGEKGFDGVLIETVGLNFWTRPQKKSNKVEIVSNITDSKISLLQKYVMSENFPTWLIYRNKFFDDVSKKLIFGKFDVFRDRQITSSMLKNKGCYRVIKSANIGNGVVLDNSEKDCYIDDVQNLAVSKFLNASDLILVPNLSYLPRACIKPKNTLVDGSAAILIKKDKTLKVKTSQLKYFSTDEFRNFYRTCRNFSTRSMNIDSNYVYYFGLLNEC